MLGEGGRRSELVGRQFWKAVEKLDVLVELGAKVFAVDWGGCRGFRANLRGGLRWWWFGE